jgi:tripartite-type tricarboxylate transporter receptor subunit TctC
MMLKTLCRTVLLLIAAIALTAQAQPYPNKPIRVMVGFGPGGVTDLVNRFVADEMGKRLGQSVVVENRPGASGLVAATAVKNAAPDGYTIYGGPTTAFSAVFLKDPNMSASKELTPISQMATGDWFVYVPTSLPIQNLKEFQAYAKANKLRFAAPSVINNMLMAVVAKHLGISYEQIPYKTTDQTIAALLQGDAQVTFNAAAGFGPHLQAGKLRVISTLSGGRIDAMPNVQTAKEQGVPVEVYSSVALWAPPATPRDIVMKLNAAAVEALRTPSVVEKIRNVSFTPLASTPEDLVKRYEGEIRFLSEAADIAGYKPQ